MKRKVLCILLLTVLVIGLTGCHKKSAASKDWKDIYFDYLSYMIKHNPVKVNRVGFVKSKVSDIPIMIVEEERANGKEKDNSLSYYWIKDGKVEFLHGSGNLDFEGIKYFYNVDKGEYDLYEVSDGSYNNHFYFLLESLIQNWAEFKNKDDFGTTFYEVLDDGFIKSDDGKGKHIEDVLIDSGIGNIMFKFKDDNDSFRKNVEELKTPDEQLTESIKQKVEKELERIKSNPKTKSETKESSSPSSKTNGISAGSYTISYGTYKSSISGYMEEFGGQYTIKPDGTFTYTNTWKDNDGNTYTNTASGTYKVEYANMKEIEEMDDDYKWVISFTATSYSGKGRFTDPTSPNDAYYNVDTYDITGNNKFQASQYENVWTYIG